MEVNFVEYKEAYNILDDNADSDKLFSYILKGDNNTAIEYIKQITNCDDIIAKALVLDLSDGLITEKTVRTNKLQYESQPINTVTCPYCHSTDTRKISGISKAGSVALWGIFALGKTTKQWHCNSCKSDF